MARSLSNAKLLSSAVVDGIKRRAFSAAASQGIARTGSGSSPVMTKKVVVEEKVAVPVHKVSWVPDPKTGYYRPDNGAEQIDVAELRAVLLKQKK